MKQEVLDEKPEQHLMTEIQVCEYLGFHRSTLRRLIDKGVFPRFFYLRPEDRAGKRWFSKDIDKYLQECAEKSGYTIDKDISIVEIHEITANKFFPHSSNVNQNRINNITKIRRIRENNASNGVISTATANKAAKPINQGLNNKEVCDGSNN